MWPIKDSLCLSFNPTFVIQRATLHLFHQSPPVLFIQRPKNAEINFCVYGLLSLSISTKNMKTIFQSAYIGEIAYQPYGDLMFKALNFKPFEGVMKPFLRRIIKLKYRIEYRRMFTFILLWIYFVSPQPRFTLIAEGSCKTLVLLV